MTRAKVTVKRLGEEAGLDLDVALLLLMDGNLNVESGSDFIPKNHHARARRLLGLSAVPHASRVCLISSLSARSGIPEKEVRDRLYRKRLIPKRRLVRVPFSFLRRAEIELGLRFLPEPARKSKTIPEAIPFDDIEETTVRKKERKRAKQKTRQRVWPTIGPEEELVFLTPKDVAEIHWILVKDYASSKDPIAPPGISSQSLLESAVHRPKTSLGTKSKYPTVAMSGAALLHSIILNHSFHNGNKRTAIVSLFVFLDKNKWVLTLGQDEIFDYLLCIADHKLKTNSGKFITDSDEEVLQIIRWLQGNIRRVQHGEHPLQFRQLRKILISFGATFDIPKGAGNRINICRLNFKTQVFYGDEGREVDRNYVHRIRQDLALDEEHGYDSDIFYNRGPRIPEFINKNRKLLDRLAKF